MIQPRQAHALCDAPITHEPALSALDALSEADTSACPPVAPDEIVPGVWETDGAWVGAVRGRFESSRTPSLVVSHNQHEGRGT